MVQEAYDTLLDAIVRGDLAPGSKLDDEDIERRYGISKALLREASARLATHWLVRVVPRRATYVTPLDPTIGAQQSDVLRALGQEAARLMIDRTGADERSRLADLVAAQPRTAEFFRNLGDEDVFEFIYDRCGNKELLRLRNWMIPYVRRFRWLYHDEIDADALFAVDDDLVAAVVAGDVEAAVDACERRVALVAGPGGWLAHLVDPDWPPTGPRAVLTRDLVADEIQSAILDGTLVPGETLPETELMNWLQVSRTPIREAMTRLAGRGLVDLATNRSARVAQLDEDTVADTVAAYGVLVRLAVHDAMTTERDALLELWEAGVAALEGEGPVDAEVVGKFNDAAFRLGGNQVAAELAQRLGARVRWYSFHQPHLVRLTRTIARRIATLVQAGDTAQLDVMLADLYTVTSSD